MLIDDLSERSDMILLFPQLVILHVVLVADEMQLPKNMTKNLKEPVYIHRNKNTN